MLKIRELLKHFSYELASGAPETAIGSFSIDSRKVALGQAFIAIKGERFDGHNFVQDAIRNGARAVIAQRLDNPTLEAAKLNSTAVIKVKDTVKALGEIARYNRERFDIPVIVVTGSNGKTTTKEMISWVLSAKHKTLKNEGTKNNHIGLPLTLANLNSTYDCAVLEAGTNHFGEIPYLSGVASPNIAVLTNIGESHLEHFQNLRGVLKEKYSLIKYLRGPKIAVYNSDDGLLRKKFQNSDNRINSFAFSLNAASEYKASKARFHKGKVEFLLNRKHAFTLNTFGLYNIYNCLPAIAIARLLGLGYPDIISRLSSFEFPEGRLRFKSRSDIRFIDDTYNSNPFSLRLALESLNYLKVKGRKILVMGDMLELGKLKENFHKAAGVHAARICDCIITVGDLAKLAADSARRKGFDKKNLFICSSNPQAKEALMKDILPRNDDIILVKGSRAMRMEEIIS